MIGIQRCSQNAMGEHIVSKTIMWFQCLTKFLSVMRWYVMKAPAKLRLMDLPCVHSWVHSQTISDSPAAPSFTHTSWMRSHSLTPSHLHTSYCRCCKSSLWILDTNSATRLPLSVFHTNTTNPLHDSKHGNVTSLFWSRLKNLNDYWMPWNEIAIHGLQRMNTNDFSDRTTFSSSVRMRFCVRDLGKF